MKVAILDDYANVALSYGDWSAVKKHAEITVFNEHVVDADMIAVLRPYDVICTLRERVHLSRPTIDQLPNLKAIVVSDPYVKSIDFAAATERGIKILRGEVPDHMPIAANSTAEFAWGLLLATVRHIPATVALLKEGQWQQIPGMSLAGMTLGVVGFGNYGTKIAKYAQAFDMNVLVWSQNLKPEVAKDAGVKPVDKATLFRESDIVTIHYRLSERSAGLVGASELGLMKSSAYLINTSRGEIIDEQALIAALKNKKIAGAGLDVFDQEPLPKDHPFLHMNNVVATPHLGFVSEQAMRHFYVGIANAVRAYAMGEVLPQLQLTQLAQH